MIDDRAPSRGPLPPSPPADFLQRSPTGVRMPAGSCSGPTLPGSDGLGPPFPGRAIYFSHPHRQG